MLFFSKNLIITLRISKKKKTINQPKNIKKSSKIQNQIKKKFFSQPDLFFYAK
jgi:hypothetical protein